MQKIESTIFSSYLKREMPLVTYGHAGKPCLVIPTRNGLSSDYESFGMVEVCRPWIEAGKLQLFCIDTIDRETWSSNNWDKAQLLRIHEQWMNYIVNELYDEITRNSTELPLVTGCSLGAFHAANLILRYPRKFDASICLSGRYDAADMLEGYMDSLAYLNSPCHSIQGMSTEHPYIEYFNQNTLIFCVGQGTWEDEYLESTRRLDALFKEKGIRATFDYWGHDVSHDWDWWKKQMAYFLEKILGA